MMESGRLLSNVTLLSLAIDSAGFGAIRIYDADTGDVYTLPCGYAILTESTRPGSGHRGQQECRASRWIALEAVT